MTEDVSVKLRRAIYPPGMVPIDMKLCQNAFQAISNVSFDDAKTKPRKFWDSVSCGTLLKIQKPPSQRILLGLSSAGWPQIFRALYSNRGWREKSLESVVFEPVWRGKLFQMKVFGAAIDPVQFASKSELSSRLFGLLKFYALFE